MQMTSDAFLDKTEFQVCWIDMILCQCEEMLYILRPVSEDENVVLFVEQLMSRGMR